MTDRLISLVPLLPLLAVLWIGLGMLFGFTVARPVNVKPVELPCWPQVCHCSYLYI